MVLLRTFSKAMSLAGLRVGYLLGQPPLVEEILKAKLPFSLNPLSCQAALTALRHRTILRSRVETIVAESDRVLTTLRAQPGIVVYIEVLLLSILSRPVSRSTTTSVLPVVMIMSAIILKQQPSPILFR